MTFEEFRKELINRIRSSEFNQYLHLYIKSRSWSDILKAVKFNGYYEWNFSNQIIDFDFLNEIPEEEREKEYIFNRPVTLENYHGSIFLLNNGKLNITQNEDFRCKVVMFGNSSLNAEIKDRSMLELEQYHNSFSTVHTLNDSFLSADIKNESKLNILSYGFSTLKLILNNSSQAQVKTNDESFLSASTFWFSKLIIHDSYVNTSFSRIMGNIEDRENYKLTKKDKSQIIIKIDSDERFL